MIQQTSMLAFLTDVKPKLNQKQHEVYRAIEAHGPITNKQLAEVMERPVNTITPRVLELREKRHIISCFVDDDGGRKAHYWGTPAHKKGYEWDEVA